MAVYTEEVPENKLVGSEEIVLLEDTGSPIRRNGWRSRSGVAWFLSVVGIAGCESALFVSKSFGKTG